MIIILLKSMLYKYYIVVTKALGSRFKLYAVLVSYHSSLSNYTTLNVSHTETKMSKKETSTFLWILKITY